MSIPAGLKTWRMMSIPAGLEMWRMMMIPTKHKLSPRKTDFLTHQKQSFPIVPLHDNRRTYYHGSTFFFNPHDRFSESQSKPSRNLPLQFNCTSVVQPSNQGHHDDENPRQTFLASKPSCVSTSTLFPNHFFGEFLPVGTALARPRAGACPRLDGLTDIPNLFLSPCS